MKTIRWGIIGCGDVTEIKSGPGFRNADHSELTAVMRRNGELAEDYAVRHGVPAWYDNAENLINDPMVDAVYIATPPAFHKPYTILCAEAGKPVYVEKPMALDYQECLEMISACRSAGVPLFAAYYRRALKRFLKIKELTESGILGDIRFVNVSLCMPPPKEDLNPRNLPWRVLPEISGGGRFVDMGSHMLDILDFIFGPIREAKGISSNQAGYYPAEDTVSGSFLFESGLHGSGRWCFTAYDSLDSTEIIGSKGKLLFSTFDDKPFRLITSRGEEEFSFTYPVHIQEPLIQTVVNAINGTGSCQSTGESAARTSRVMDILLENYR